MSARMFVHLMGKKVECARNLVAAVAFSPPSKKVEHLPLGWDACQCWVYEETGRGGRVCLIGYS